MNKYDIIIPGGVSYISTALELLEGGPLSPKQLKEKLKEKGDQINYSHITFFLCDFGFTAYNKADGRLYPNRVLMENPELFARLRENYSKPGMDILTHPSNYEPNGEFEFEEGGNWKPFRLSYEHFLELAETKEGREWLEITMENSDNPFLTEERFRDLSGAPLVDFQKLLQ